MTQKALGRLHIALDSKALQQVVALAVIMGGYQKTGRLIVSAILCCISLFEERLKNEGKSSFVANKVKVDTKALDRAESLVKMQVYFGTEAGLIDKVKSLAEVTGRSATWLVARMVDVALPVFEKRIPKMVEKGTPFECCGVEVKP